MNDKIKGQDKKQDKNLNDRYVGLRRLRALKCILILFN